MGRLGGNRCGATMMGVHGFACRDKSDTALFGAGGIVTQQTFLTPGAHAAPPGRVPVRPSPRTRQGCRRRWFVGTTSCRSLRPQTGCVSDLLRRHTRAGFARKSAGMGTSTIGSATTAPRAPVACHDPRLPSPDPAVALTVTLEAADRLALLRRLGDHPTGHAWRQLPEAWRPQYCVYLASDLHERAQAPATRPGPARAADPG